MSNLMRDPNQPPPQVDLEGVGENITDGTQAPSILIVEVRFVPNDIPRFRRDFATAAAAAEFMCACQPDPNAVGSILQANAKRAKLLRIGVNELTTHSVETEVIRIICAEDMDASALQVEEEDAEIDTFVPGDDANLDDEVETSADQNIVTDTVEEEDEVETEQLEVEDLEEEEE